MPQNNNNNNNMKGWIGKDSQRNILPAPAESSKMCHPWSRLLSHSPSVHGADHWVIHHPSMEQTAESFTITLWSTLLSHPKCVFELTYFWVIQNSFLEETVKSFQLVRHIFAKVFLFHLCSTFHSCGIHSLWNTCHCCGTMIAEASVLEEYMTLLSHYQIFKSIYYGIQVFIFTYMLSLWHY